MRLAGEYAGLEIIFFPVLCFLCEVVREELCDRSRSVFSYGFLVVVLSFWVDELRDVVLIGRRGGVPWEVFISVMVKFAFAYHICLPRLFTSAVRRRKKWPLSGPKVAP